MIEGRGQLIAVDVLYYEESSENASTDLYRAASNEEDGSGLVESGVTEEV